MSTKFKIIAIVFILIIGTWLLLRATGKIKSVNIQTSAVNLVCVGLFTKECHLRLSDKIEASTYYKIVLSELDFLDKYDTLYVHIAGFGGDSDSMHQLMTKIGSLPSNTVAIIEGDTYSAHSMIAFSAKKIVVTKATVIMLHSVQVNNSTPVSQYIVTGCPAKSVTPAALVKEKQCYDVMNALKYRDDTLFQIFFNDVLTVKEMQDISNNAKEIYITGDELSKRSKRVIVSDGLVK